MAEEVAAANIAIFRRAREIEQLRGKPVGAATREMLGWLERDIEAFAELLRGGRRWPTRAPATPWPVQPAGTVPDVVPAGRAWVPGRSLPSSSWRCPTLHRHGRSILLLQAERDDARAVFDQFDIVWRTAVQQRRGAEYDETVPAYRRQDLADAEEAARERRDRAWAGVVRGNGAADAAARAAVLRTD
jgi:hypothetical protein